jgi:acetyl-CoA carboxylase biotin carboxyl carrier protein
MNAKEIKDLISFISTSGLWEVNIETENIKLSVKRGSQMPAVLANSVQQQVEAVAVATASPTPAQPVAASAPAQEAPAVVSTSNTATIKSPMIGTFYRSSSPDSPPFKNVGDTVKKGEVVCIIEAMKLFNEIESEIDGEIIKVLVDNASPVEYDQPLFLVQA